jgi:hypothetical protein
MPKNPWIRFILFVILPSVFAAFAWSWPWFFYSAGIIFVVDKIFKGSLAPISAVIAALIGGLALGHWSFYYSAVYWTLCLVFWDMK